MAATKTGHYKGTGFEFNVSGLGLKMGRLRGQFVSAQVEIGAAHKRAAENLQASMVKVLESRIRETGRPQRETRYLIRALLDEGNIRHSADGFDAGIPEHLQRSQARQYWKNLERGTTTFVGRQIVGFFRTIEGKGVGPHRGGKDPRLIQLHPSIGAGGAQGDIRVGRSTNQIVSDRGQRIDAATANRFGRNAPRTSLGTKDGRYHSASAGVGTRAAVAVQDSGRGYRTDRVPGRGDGGHFITIRHPIQAYEYMARGTQQWANSGDLEQQYQRALIEFQKFLTFASTNNLSTGAARARLR